MSLQTRFQTMLSAVYPPRCLACGEMVESNYGLCGPCWRDTAFVGSTICDTCGMPLPGDADPDEVLVCDDCTRQPRPWQRGRAAVLYNGTGRRLVLALKHGDRQDMARPAARWLANAGQDLLEDDSLLIVPIPLHWKRLLARRYNQSALLAHALAQETRRAWCPDLLQRQRSTPSLDGKTRDQRFATLRAAFRIHPRRRHRIIGRGVLLVDDVFTSGATFATAAGACLAAGADHVNVLALARVAKDP